MPKYDEPRGLLLFAYTKTCTNRSTYRRLRFTDFVEAISNRVVKFRFKFLSRGLQFSAGASRGQGPGTKFLTPLKNLEQLKIETSNLMYE